MSLLLWKNSNALKKALILNLMKTHLTVILYISQLIKKPLLTLWNGNISFFLGCKAHFLL